MAPSTIVLHAGLKAQIWGLVAASLLTIGASAFAGASEAPQSLPTVTLSAGMHNIQAEVARTPQELSTGLMHRSSMPANHGMLFVFEQPGQQCFWMKNTLIPLAIAFLADDGRVVNIAEMQAGSLDQHCSKEPVRFALEMNKGWFKRKGVREGHRLSGPPFSAASTSGSAAAR